MRSAQASVEKRGEGVWKIYVELPRNPKTGKRQRMTKTVRGSRKDAERTKVSMLAMAGKPEAAMDSMTLAQFWDDIYRPYAEKHLRPTSLQGYKSKWNSYIEPHPIAGMELQRITPVVISRWLSSIDGEAKRGKAFQLLRLLLNRAVKSQLIPSNPCKGVDAPKPSEYEPEVLTAEEARAYIEHFKGDRMEPVVLLALGGGFRRSEIVALDWGDITEDGVVTVDNAVTSVGGRAEDGKTKSRFSERTVMLPESIARRLNEIRGEGPVARSKTGLRANPDHVSHDYAKALKTLPEGVRRICLKNLRHTSLTLTLEGGADLLAVSRRGGHSTVAITSRYYLRPGKSVDKAAADSLGSVLG